MEDEETATIDLKKLVPRSFFRRSVLGSTDPNWQIFKHYRRF
jgi:hypothetical protein